MASKKENAPARGVVRPNKNPLPETGKGRGLKARILSGLVPTPFTSKVVENRQRRVFWLPAGFRRVTVAGQRRPYTGFPRVLCSIFV
jgi:hypothetical protein